MRRAKTNAGPFPKDILRLILMLLDSRADLLRCQLTCRSWRALIVENALLDRLFDETRILDFNDWGGGVRPSQVTSKMVKVLAVSKTERRSNCVWLSLAT
jgi:hypothetical protein